MTKTTHEEDVNRLKEIETTIDKLYDEQNQIRDRLLLDDINGKLGRIMDKWVVIPGWDPCDEADGDNYFRLGKVVGFKAWDGNDRYFLQFSRLVYMGHAKKDDQYDKNAQVIKFTSKKDMENHCVGDIKRAKVITARKASKMIDDALASITRRLKNVQNEALKDYADKEMTK